MPLSFNISANPVLPPVLLSRLSPDSSFVSRAVCCNAASDYLTHVFFLSFLCNPSIVSVYLLNYHNELLS